MIKIKNKFKLKLSLIMFISIFLFVSINPVFADSMAGSQIITLGKDLSKTQRDQILQQFEAAQDVPIVEVTNQEEHQYLGDTLPAKVIGSKAISSSMITFGESGSGLTIDSNNITWVTNEMYISALTTAGISDAEIKVTAPFPVSGTAALTGIIKAFEQATGKEINEDVKKVANEEMVRTAQLADQIGDKEKAVEFMKRIKEELAKQSAKLSDAELRALIEQVAQDLNIQLTGDELNSLISLLRKLQNANIDWDLVSQRLDQIKTGFQNFVQNNPEAKSFFRELLNFIKNLIDKILSWLG
ncbi:DUF1002 domain-containing protein [Tepidibacillus infernus]|uniref:DUF1002 domain-containing protein n=1 Tax=Tepidibacillus decaturensis TaxID=1413211 RepID=A0A135L4S7_9BACI|nr:MULTISPECIES: DUF1002 domain-containing protein [Tepidibacillus]KXG44008.1 hypothetical protein U473_08315 [Tepidibacillus decaturensis]GBF10397.1 hypothetical protein HK1_00409 [Tepidibacillus sp. HK-1]